MCRNAHLLLERTCKINVEVDSIPIKQTLKGKSLIQCSTDIGAIFWKRETSRHVKDTQLFSSKQTYIRTWLSPCEIIFTSWPSRAVKGEGALRVPFVLVVQQCHTQGICDTVWQFRAVIAIKHNPGPHWFVVEVIINKGGLWVIANNWNIKWLYSRTSMARTPLGPWKLVRDRGSSSQWGLIIAPGQEA